MQASELPLHDLATIGPNVWRWNSWVERNDESSYSILQHFTILPHNHRWFDLAVEEKMALSPKDAVNGIKTGLMGPFAPLGDTSFGSLVTCYHGSIAATIWLSLVNLRVSSFSCSCSSVWYRWKQLEFAYKEGLTLSTTCKSTLTALIEAASVLLYSWWIALVATMTNFEISYKLPIGEKDDWLPRPSQTQIFHILLPAILLHSSSLLGKKGELYKAIGIIIVLALALSALGKIYLEWAHGMTKSLIFSEPRLFSGRT